MTTLSIDFETRATVELKDTGVYPYAKHADTDVWCFAWAFDDEEPELWTPTVHGTVTHYYDVPQRIVDHIAAGGELRAWNAQFERIIWKYILAPRYGFPEPRLEQWVCSAAEAAAMALPRHLDGAASVLRVKQQKDKEGYALMMKLTKPRKIVDGRPVWWSEDPKQGHDMLERLYAYCKQDVRTERSIVKALRRLTPREREVYLHDQLVNDRGFEIDRPLAESAHVVAREGVERANVMLNHLTGGDVTKVTQNARLKKWVTEQGVDTPGIAKKDVKALMEGDTLDESVRQVLQLRADAGRTSVAKLLAMVVSADVEDDRIRGSTLYHAASTGRWGGRGVQPHNLPRGDLKYAVLETLIPAVLEQRYDAIDLFAHPVVVVSSMLRLMIKAAYGRTLMAGDFAAIEACVTNWLAEQTDVADMFRRYVAGDKSADPYKAMAVRMGRAATLAEVTFLDRQAGKAAELGCGFGMGDEKFVTAAWDVYQVRVSEAEAESAVKIYRDTHPRVKAFWYETENACLDAVRSPGQKFRFGVNSCLTAIRAGAYLYLVLPSGRPLCFAAPSVKLTVMTKTRKDGTVDRWEKDTLHFWGVDAKTKQWGELRTYGGHLVENIVQAVARDLLAEGMLRVEAAGYPVILSVHDEVVTEPEEGFGSVKELEALLAIPPVWAVGCPIGVEGWQGPRYRK